MDIGQAEQGAVAGCAVADDMCGVGVCRFAELDKSIKNVISHRARAIELVKAYFNKLDAQQ